MDLLQASVLALFYDYPLDKVAQWLSGNIENCTDSTLFEIMPELTKWRSRTFTLTELELMERYCKEDFSSKGGKSLIKPFYLLQDLSDKLVMTDINGNPIVKYENLLRWQYIATLLGEDLLTLSYLAKNDNNPRAFFTWSDCIEHDDEKVNSLLNEGLADTHAHLSGSHNAFDLGWITRMNNMCLRDNKDPLCKVKHEHPINEWFRGANLDLHDWAIIAAELRMYLFRIMVYGQKDQEWEDSFYLLLGSQTERVNKLRELPQNAGVLGRYSLRIRKDSQKSWDYAIQIKDIESDIDTNTPYMTLQGERRLIYSYLQEIGKDSVMAHNLPYMYLYLLIKTRCRREIVLTNGYIGLENFQIYEGACSSFLKTSKCPNKLDVVAEIARSYTVQSALGKCLNNRLELRCSPKHFDFLRKGHLRRSIFGSRDVFLHDFDKQLFLIGIFSKSNIKKDELHKQTLDIVNAKSKNRNKDSHEIPYLNVTGIDVGGIDVGGKGKNKKKPEFFAQAYRYAKGKLGRTYHVAEDYIDIVGGLRYIDEAVTFFEMSRADRLGHALALGANTETFYGRRQYSVTAERQYFLDNAVWLLYRSKELNIDVEEGIFIKLETFAQELYSKAKYPNGHKLYDYWKSMLLRSESIQDKSYNATYAKAGIPQNKRCICHDANTDDLWNHYRAYGSKSPCSDIITKEWPREVIPLVKQIQGKLLKKIRNKGITIESCPTSNLLIGHFDRYDEHPLYYFYTIEEAEQSKIPLVSINTDEKGIFATSLRREYSLICLALEKKLIHDNHIDIILARQKAICYVSKIAREVKMFDIQTR